jgi:hypothetical protein
MTKLNQLMAVSEYRKKRFAGRKKPSEKTIKRWIVDGYLPGKKIGGRYYVEVTLETQLTGNPLADAAILRLMTEDGD